MEQPIITDFSIATLHQWITVRAEQFINENLPEIVRVTGTLSGLGKVSGQWCYGLTMTDGGSQVMLDVPSGQVMQEMAGQRVRVTGVVKARVAKYNGSMEIRVEASHIEMCNPIVDDVTPVKTGIMSVEQLKSLPSHRVLFPAFRGEPISITVIQSRSAQALVGADAMAEIDKLGNYVLVRHVQINMLDPEAIANAIQQTSTDILLLIRGGGPEADFMVFDDTRVVESLSRCCAYCVLGLGHSGNATILDFIADHSSRTPAQAGLHIRECIEQKLQRAKAQAEQIQKSDKALQEAERRLAEKLAVPEVQFPYWKLILSFVLGLVVAVILTAK